MKILFSPLHKNHWLKFEFSVGQYQPCFENPSRAKMVATEIRQRNLGEIFEPKIYPETCIERIHTIDYIDFLKNCWAQWEQEMGPDHDAIASVFSRPAQKHRKGKSIGGKLGYYSTDTAVGLGENSWLAIKSSAEEPLSAHRAEAPYLRGKPACPRL